MLDELLLFSLDLDVLLRASLGLDDPRGFSLVLDVLLRFFGLVCSRRLFFTPLIEHPGVTAGLLLTMFMFPWADAHCASPWGF